MKAIELLNDSLKLMGYTDVNSNSGITQKIKNNAIITVNLVYSDLWKVFNEKPFEPIKSLTDEINLPLQMPTDVFLYGLAMHIARSENDGDQQQFYTYLYNSKRAGLTVMTKVKNIIPRGGDR